MKQLVLVLFAALALASCAARPIGATAPTGAGRIAEGRLDLGEWTRGSQDATARRFAQTIAARYGAGVPLQAAAADLRENQFSCAPNRERRGDPPDMICRRTIQGAGCINTWQVHLYSDAGSQGLTRTRGLFDKSCSRDELLGGR
ncbi:MAG: hypothetical protein JNJ73_10445 [Hyphomonadaceae bacterium]|nr:hypothetical protein [Hyphomonadaceae bacterium]